MVYLRFAQISLLILPRFGHEEVYQIWYAKSILPLLASESSQSLHVRVVCIEVYCIENHDKSFTHFRANKNFI